MKSGHKIGQTGDRSDLAAPLLDGMIVMLLYALCQLIDRLCFMIESKERIRFRIFIPFDCIFNDFDLLFKGIVTLGLSGVFYVYRRRKLADSFLTKLF